MHTADASSVVQSPPQLCVWEVGKKGVGNNEIVVFQNRSTEKNVLIYILSLFFFFFTKVKKK